MTALKAIGHPHLFRPFRLRGLELPNRIVLAPMSSSLGDRDGFVTPALSAFLRERALGGTGLITVEFTCVESRFGLGETCQLRLDRDEHIPAHAALVKTITEAGARACLQLHLPGQYVAAGTAEGGMPVAPSAVFGRRDGSQIARELLPAEIEHLIRSFAVATRRAIEAGYPAIELHGAHGYLLMAFMSPLKNRRDDEWGGDFERRLNFPLAVVRAVREALGEERPLIYRLSAAEFLEAGLTIEDMERIAPRLVGAGVDALHVSTGTIEGALDKVVDPMSIGEGWRFALSRRIRQAAGVPVIAVGPVRWPAEGERAIRDGDADLIALGRTLLADPHWARKAKAGDERSITPCTSCNWCMDRVHRHLPIGCAENPRAGRESEDAGNPATGRGQVAVVIGAGPGGLFAALELDRLGFAVHLFEARHEIGGGLIVSAAPPFKEKLRWYLDHLQHELGRSRVQLHLDTRPDAAALIALRPRLAIIATGSRARALHIHREGGPPLFDAHAVLMGDQQLALDAGLVVIYGGGETGCETAEYMAARGASVLLVTRSALADLARSAEPMYRKQLRLRLADNASIRIVERTAIAAITAEGIVLEGPDGEHVIGNARAVVIAQGREPAAGLINALNDAGIASAAIGDAEGIGRIGDAVNAAYLAIRGLVA